MIKKVVEGKGSGCGQNADKLIRMSGQNADFLRTLKALGIGHCGQSGLFFLLIGLGFEKEKSGGKSKVWG